MRIQTRTPFVVMACAVGSILVTTTLWRALDPHLVINVTPSAPEGVYHIVPHPIGEFRRGMYVVFAVPDALQGMVYGRRWLRPGVPLLKHLQGLEGDQVCIEDKGLSINRRWIGPVYRTDRIGQALPTLRGCFLVPAGYFFAASSTINESFDGRYFGPQPLTVLQGEAKPVWTF